MWSWRDAETMIDETIAGRVLAGVRGRPRGDRTALVDALLRLSDLALVTGDAVDELAINPFIVLDEGRGAVAVDVRVAGRKESER